MQILEFKRDRKVLQYRFREQAVIASALQTVYSRLLSGNIQLKLQNVRVDAQQFGQVVLYYLRHDALAYPGGSASVSQPPTPVGSRVGDSAAYAHLRIGNSP